MLLFTLPIKGKAKAAEIQTTVLSRMTLTNTISATGYVESTETTNVYSSLSTSLVKAVNVKVGDKVNAGDILAVLDTDNLKLDISQQEAAIASANASAKHNLDVSQKAYDNAKATLDEGLNATLLQAQNAVTTAQNTLRNAQDTYDNLDDNTDETQADYVSARNDWKDANEATKEARRDLEEAKKTGDETKIALAQDTYKKAQKIEADLKVTFDQMKEAYKATNNTYNQAETALENAKANYESAQKQLKAAYESIDQQIDNYSDSIKTAQIAADNQASQIALQKLKKQLADSTITAPVSGTVTAVNAKEGSPAGSLLFVIEDTDNLQIDTTINEYDISSVKVGMKTIIKSDGVGESEIPGTLSEIAPTSKKAADGTTITGSTIEFPAKVTVDAKSSGLRVGMNARLNMIVDTKENVFAVPYDTVFEKEGETYIYTAVKNEKGVYTAKSVPVETGIETDFYIEISGDGLSDGMIVIATPDFVQEGSKVEIGNAE